MEAQKKKMIFLFSIIAVVVLAVVIIVIGQLTGSFSIFDTDGNSASSSQSGSKSSSSAIYENTESTNIGGNASATYSPEESFQAKSDDFYIGLAKEHPVKISKEAYQKTKIMENQEKSLSYDEVVAIIGGEGVKVDSNYDYIEIYMWATADGTGYAKLTFENGVLTGRAQWGLN